MYTEIMFRLEYKAKPMKTKNILIAYFFTELIVILENGEGRSTILHIGKLFP